jgi:small subunit ribosomal protein S14
MARKSILEREKKRRICVRKYAEKRNALLSSFRKAISLEEKLTISKKIQKLPRDSSPTRTRNRCWKTGRSRGYYRFFGLCRNALREMAHDCFLPGVTKSSW